MKNVAAATDATTEVLTQEAFKGYPLISWGLPGGLASSEVISLLFHGLASAKVETFIGQVVFEGVALLQVEVTFGMVVIKAL